MSFFHKTSRPLKVLGIVDAVSLFGLFGALVYGLYTGSLLLPIVGIIYAGFWLLVSWTYSNSCRFWFPTIFGLSLQGRVFYNDPNITTFSILVAVFISFMTLYYQDIFGVITLVVIARCVIPPIFFSHAIASSLERQNGK